MKVLTLILLLWLPAFPVHADDAAAEIDYLLRSVGSSGCVFIRNGESHGSREAEEHLRMKYKRATRYASTSEKFIERLASKSFLSKKLYYIECEGSEKIPSGDWLMKQLYEYRTGTNNG